MAYAEDWFIGNLMVEARLMGRDQEVALQGQIETFLRDMESRGDGSNPIDSDFRERSLG